jgi:transposase-like protein
MGARGPKPGNPRAVYSPEIRAQAVELSKQGLSRQAIADKLGLSSPSIVYYWLTQAEKKAAGDASDPAKFVGRRKPGRKPKAQTNGHADEDWREQLAKDAGHVQPPIRARTDNPPRQTALAFPGGERDAVNALREENARLRAAIAALTRLL